MAPAALSCSCQYQQADARERHSCMQYMQMSEWPGSLEFGNNHSAFMQTA